jgi:nickel/cobalt transporter (NicO) family protein
VPGFSELLQQGADKAWLFIPSAVLLGVLHGLEPGHSKTMMAAFIVAIRGTVWQAVMLGLAATVSHTAIVWIIALLGLHLGRQSDAEATEPYLQLTSAVIIGAVAVWMLLRTWNDQRRQSAHSHDHHDHASGHGHDHDHGLNVGAPGSGNAHERQHAEQIRYRFASRHVTNWQIVIFGLTGGLIPCPAAITVLLICLQLRHFALGVALVLCFSIGLAATMMATGALAALGMRRVAGRWEILQTLMQRAPYISGSLILCIAAYVGWEGLSHFV